MNPKQILIFITLIFIYTCSGLAQENKRYSRSSILNAYIEKGLQDNLALKQKEFDLQKSSAALDEARGLFLPTFGISARYSRAGGGRSFEMPLGDFMNPVYGSLNEIFTALGQAQRPFPTLENQTFNFYRKKEHETKVRLIQPIFQPAIYYNYKITDKLKNISMLEIHIYQRELIKEIKQSYFKIIESSKVLGLLASTEKLLEENLRVSQKLLENQMVTKETIYRSNAELLQIKQKILEAENRNKMAKRYFNFLLNRSLDKSIELIHEKYTELIIPHNIEESTQKALKNRNEFQQLAMAIKIKEDEQNLHTASILPTLNLVADFGYQGEEYNFDDGHDYWMASGILEWNLFKGFQDKAKKEQAQIESKKLKLQELELNKKIELQVHSIVYQIDVLIEAITVSAERKKSAKESFRIIDKKYKNGQAALFEFLDARNTLTRSEIDEILIRFQYWETVAELEWVTADMEI